MAAIDTEKLKKDERFETLKLLTEVWSVGECLSLPAFEGLCLLINHVFRS